MRPRTSSDLFPSTTQKIVPGPGAHKHYEAISPNGRYGYSKYRNSLSKTWNPKQSQRFYKSTTDAPGPGTYRPVNDLNGKGHYVLSNNKSAGKRMMSMTSKRNSFVDDFAHRSETPGPGSYRAPSDFGIYDHLYRCGCSQIINDTSTRNSVKLSQSQIIDTKHPNTPDTMLSSSG